MLFRSGPHKKFEIMKAMVSFFRDYGALTLAGEIFLELLEMNLDDEQLEQITDLAEENQNLIPAELIQEKLDLLGIEKP